MMLKFPNSKYKITITTEIEDPNALSDDDKVLLGWADYANREILLAKNPYMYEVLLHEIVHVLLIECGMIDLGHNEIAVSSITDKLLYLLRKNKKIFMKIMEGERNGKKTVQALNKGVSASSSQKKRTRPDKATVDEDEQDASS
ncbi:MAG: hypothetical protein ABDH59_08965 [Fervidobacterium sp.]